MHVNNKHTKQSTHTRTNTAESKKKINKTAFNVFSNSSLIRLFHNKS